MLNKRDQCLILNLLTYKIQVKTRFKLSKERINSSWLIQWTAGLAFRKLTTKRFLHWVKPAQFLKSWKQLIIQISIRKTNLKFFRKRPQLLILQPWLMRPQRAFNNLLRLPISFTRVTPSRTLKACKSGLLIST